MANTLRITFLLSIAVSLFFFSVDEACLATCPSNPQNGLNSSGTNFTLQANEKLQVNPISKLQSEAFAQYFTIFDTLSLNYPDLAIGDISRMLDVGNGDRLVIEDAITHAVYWIDVKQNLQKKLSVEHTVPGHELSVISISADPEDGFWISSVPNFVFQFSGNGQLVKFVKIPGHNLSRKFLVDNKRGIIAVIDHGESSYVLRYNTVNDNLDTLFAIENNPQLKNIIQRLEGGGFLTDQKNNLYFSNAIEDKIFKYNLKGQVLAVFNGSNKRFKAIEQDVPENKEGVLAFFSKKPKFSSIISMYLLNQEQLIALYSIDNRANVSIISKNSGTVFNKTEIILSAHMAYAGNNLIYLIKEPDDIAAEGNPAILRYKYLGK